MRFLLISQREELLGFTAVAVSETSSRGVESDELSNWTTFSEIVPNGELIIRFPTEGLGFASLSSLAREAAVVARRISSEKTRDRFALSRRRERYVKDTFHHPARS